MVEQVQIRRAQPRDLSTILDLYHDLLVTDLPMPPQSIVNQRWSELLADPRMHCLVADVDDTLVASCTLAIIPNMTRGTRPYGIIENVVSHAAFRRRGLGTRILHAALTIAWEHHCYKVMLLTSSKDPAVHHFYEQAGFHGGVKTGFIVRADDFHA